MLAYLWLGAVGLAVCSHSLPGSVCARCICVCAGLVTVWQHQPASVLQMITYSPYNPLYQYSYNDNDDAGWSRLMRCCPVAVTASSGHYSARRPGWLTDPTWRRPAAPDYMQIACTAHVIRLTNAQPSRALSGRRPLTQPCKPGADWPAAPAHWRVT